MNFLKLLNSPKHLRLLGGTIMAASVMSNTALAADTAFSQFEGKRVRGLATAQLAGFTVANMEFEFSVNDGHYEVKSSAKSQGFVNWLWKFRSDVVARGRVTADGVEPLEYTLDAYSGGHDRRVKLVYDPAGHVTPVELSPTPEEEERQKVPEEEVVDTLDPATMFVSVLYGALEASAAHGAGQIQETASSGQAIEGAAPFSCDVEQRLYDGYRLSEVSIEPHENGTDASNAGQHEVKSLYDFSNALPCVLKGDVLYGRTPKEAKEAAKRDAEESSDDPAVLWFARSRNSNLLLPAVISKRTRFGTGIVRLMEFTIVDDEVTEAHLHEN